MFTGLIEDLGTVRELRHGGSKVQLSVTTALPMDEFSLGDSIAVNGICLTVVEFGGGIFVADVSPETLHSSNLGALAPGSEVNLERALQLSDRLGGHMVSGHIDATATVVDKVTDGNAVRFTFSLAAEILRYVVEKGSITIDGISLTVNEVTESTLSVAIIPHSLAHTTLKNIQVGGRVNIETDIIARYVEKLLTGQPAKATSSLTMEHLAQHGFV
ncbi:MAG: riboflavin synthase [Desulfuromonas sp.]|nr:riboflavin synthase [Desulfuromonas sp.]